MVPEGKEILIKKIKEIKGWEFDKTIQDNMA